MVPVRTMPHGNNKLCFDVSQLKWFTFVYHVYFGGHCLSFFSFFSARLVVGTLLLLDLFDP